MQAGVHHEAHLRVRIEYIVIALLGWRYPDVRVREAKALCVVEVIDEDRVVHRRTMALGA